MKNILVTLGVTFIIAGLLLLYQKDLQKTYYQILKTFTQENRVLEKNEYYRDYRDVTRRTKITNAK